MLEIFSHAGRHGVPLICSPSILTLFEVVPDLHRLSDDPCLDGHPGRAQPVLLSSNLLLHLYELLEPRDQVEHSGRGRDLGRGGEEKKRRKTLLKRRERLGERWRGGPQGGRGS